MNSTGAVWFLLGAAPAAAAQAVMRMADWFFLGPVPESRSYPTKLIGLITRSSGQPDPDKAKITPS